MKRQNVTVQQNGGVGILGLLAIVLMVLKLTGVIDWSWWAVWAPVWIPVLFLAFFFLVGAVVVVVKELRR